ncbi:MAG: hypothetical protein GY768_26475 [Planctomycetaceae bacterium]|nr:hypothetical protein [Planctomycetaceae bacterium]
MRKVLALAALFFLLAVIMPAFGDHPKTAIRNGIITAKVYLPNATTGYYRGTRFDWSGVIYSLQHDGHEYFGEWQQSDDPYLHDRITGPVDSFDVDTEIDDDESFLRIGVGVCAKRTDQSVIKHPFRIVNSGNWKIRQGANWIEFIHQLDDEATGHAYRYVKRMTLTPSKAELVIDHSLENLGTHTIETSVYNHNFFVMDGQPTGPDFVVRFPFQPVADRDLNGLAELHGKELSYVREVEPGRQIFTLLTGFGSGLDDSAFSIENRKIAAGVRSRWDRPIEKMQYWSPRTTLCPEPFLKLNVESGHSDRWSNQYTFYSLD